MAQVKIVTDSGAYLPDAGMIARYKIEVIPMVVHVSGQRYPERINQTDDAFLRRMSQPDTNVPVEPPNLGQVQAIGGVNEKIEGFFDICHARGLNGEQGVVIPAANVQHLMLRQDVVQAVAEGRFHIYPVAQVDEALELLTGMAAEEVNAKVDGRIVPLTYRLQSGKRRSNSHGNHRMVKKRTPFQRKRQTSYANLRLYRSCRRPEFYSTISFEYPQGSFTEHASTQLHYDKRCKKRFEQTKRYGHEQ